MRIIVKNKIALVIYISIKRNTVASVIEDDNLWLTQKSLADLFECGANTVNYHINEIYASNELDEKSTFRNFRIVQKEGNREVKRNAKINFTFNIGIISGNLFIKYINY